jgi:hypothetical protein
MGSPFGKKIMQSGGVGFSKIAEQDLQDVSRLTGSGLLILRQLVNRV